MSGLDNVKRSNAAKGKNLEKWRKSLVHEEVLPSGLEVKLRDVSMTDLLFTGKLPETMLDMAQSAADGGAASVDLKQIAKNGAEFAVLMDALARLCLVEPKIADAADDNHITLDELNADDKMFIFNWANREVEQIRPFREGEAEPLAAVQPGKRNGKTAE